MYLVKTQNRPVVARGRGRGVSNTGVWGVKRHKFPVVSSISPGEVVYSMVTIVNNTAFCI